MNLSPNELQRRRSSSNTNQGGNQQQQQDVSFGLAAQWLEQQQQQQQQQQPSLGSIDPALLLLDPTQQQRMLLQQRQQLGGGSSSSNSGSAGLPPNDLAYLLELQQQQQRRQSVTSASQDLPLSLQQQDALLFMMDEAARGAPSSSRSSDPNLSHNIARLLAGAATATPTSTPIAPDRHVRPVNADLIDRLLAAELSNAAASNSNSGDYHAGNLHLHKMEEAARVLQLREALQREGATGTSTSLPPNLARAAPLPAGNIMRSSYQTTNSAPQQQHDPQILPAMFNSASVGLPPLASRATGMSPSGTSLLFDNPFRYGTSQKGGTSLTEKRKATDAAMGAPEKKRASTSSTTTNATSAGRTISATLVNLPVSELAVQASFPMPPRKKGGLRKMTFSLASYKSLWDELEESEMQEEAFRRRIFEGISISKGASRSVVDSKP